MSDLDYLEQYTQDQVNTIANELWDKLTKKCSRQEKPQLWIIGGQPGAGKSSSKRKIESNLNSNIINIDYDEIRAKHPNAKKLYQKGKEDSSDYSVRTNQFAKEVGNILIKRAAENNYNIMIEKTMNKSSSVKELIKQLPNHDVNISVVTCNAVNSKNSVYARYQMAKYKFENNSRTNEPPRFIESYYIDKCLQGLGKATQEIATDPTIKLKNLRIETRNENFIYRPLFDINAKQSKNISTRLLECNPKQIERLINNAIGLEVTSKNKEKNR